VVHDSNDLGIIYEVLPIFNSQLPGASKVNRPLFKGMKNKYVQILKRLGQGVPPRSRDEKRVAALFKGAGNKRLLQAADAVRVQVGQKDRFLEGVIRSGAYMDTIKKIFKKKGMPQDLAYLPHVESSFNLKAYSKFGASGIWQFTRSTGEQFLTINYMLDERQDPILASHAAAQFLKNNYLSLGSWPLAITAYNYGPAGMRRAKKAHGSYEKVFRHYRQGYFKFASRNFYSEFLAALRVAKKLEKSPGIRLDTPVKTTQFTLPAYLAIKDIYTHLQVSDATVRKLNPALREPVFQGKKYIPKGYTLNLPHSSAQKKLVASLPKHTYHKKQKATKFHRVRAGDTAGRIAQKYGVSLTALRQVNGLDKNAAILVGQNLQIPFKGASRKEKSTAIASTHIRTAEKKTMPGPGTTKSSVPQLTDSKKTEPAWKNIQQARSVVLGDLSIRSIEKKGESRQGTIIVQPGESLKVIADWLEVSPKRLRKLNSFPPDRLLHPDENIHIPLGHISPQTFEEKRFDFHLETEEDFFSNYKVVGVKTYTVQQGDTLWEICRTKFDLPFWLLKKYNRNLNFSGLRSSQQLTIPIVRTL
ncbi:MAG: LysM peptidoglycan-binding domain-containing protein, partial [Thermodesulfobacteriota bacterium]